MPEWTITYNDPVWLPVEETPDRYFYIADDPYHHRRGELFLFNPPPIQAAKSWLEYLSMYQRLVGRFPCGGLTRAKAVREFLGINKSKCLGMMRYLCTFGYAERYAAGILWRWLDSHNRRPYGIHYMMKKKELPMEYYVWLEQQRSNE